MLPICYYRCYHYQQGTYDRDRDCCCYPHGRLGSAIRLAEDDRTIATSQSSRNCAFPPPHIHITTGTASLASTASLESTVPTGEPPQIQPTVSRPADHSIAYAHPPRAPTTPQPHTAGYFAVCLSVCLLLCFPWARDALQHCCTGIVRLPVCLFVCLAVWLSGSLAVWLSGCLCTSMCQCVNVSNGEKGRQVRVQLLACVN